MARTEQDILNELDLTSSDLKEVRARVNQLRTDLLNAETVLIGKKLHKEKLVEELRRMKLNNQ